MKKMICFFMCAFLLAAGSVSAQEAVVEAGKIVKFHYTLLVDGEQKESSWEGEPLEYVHGRRMLVAGMEAALEGMKVGEEKHVVMPPEKAYGPIYPSLVVETPKAKLAEGLDVEVGMMLKSRTSAGQPLTGKVVEVKEDTIVVDFNHPLAGKELTFDFKVISIENAN